MTEQTFRREFLIPALEKAGYMVVPQNARTNGRPSSHYKPGTPDLAVIGKSGLTHWLEVKTDRGPVRKEQQEFFDKCPAPCYVVRPRTMKAVLVLMAEAEERR